MWFHPASHLCLLSSMKATSCWSWRRRTSRAGVKVVWTPASWVCTRPITWSRSNLLRLRTLVPSEGTNPDWTVRSWPHIARDLSKQSFLVLSGLSRHRSAHHRPEWNPITNHRLCNPSKKHPSSFVCVAVFDFSRDANMPYSVSSHLSDVVSSLVPGQREWAMHCAFHVYILISFFFFYRLDTCTVFFLCEIFTCLASWE